MMVGMGYAVTLYGASDDLIEMDGAIYEEFNPRFEDDGGDLVVFSTGTVARILYNDYGEWRITIVHEGDADLKLVQAPESDDSNYSDRLTVTARDERLIAWVVVNNQFVLGR